MWEYGQDEWGECSIEEKTKKKLYLIWHHGFCKFESLLLPCAVIVIWEKLLDGGLMIFYSFRHLFMFVYNKLLSSSSCTKGYGNVFYKSHAWFYHCMLTTYTNSSLFYPHGKPSFEGSGNHGFPIIIMETGWCLICKRYELRDIKQRRKRAKRDKRERQRETFKTCSRLRYKLWGCI